MSNRKPTTDKEVNNLTKNLPINSTTQLINECNMKLYKLPPIDCHDDNQLANRLDIYFNTVFSYGLKPTMASLSMALGVNRDTLLKWINGLYNDNFSTLALEMLKKAYQIINASMEDYMVNGQINPVAGIFLMKNNFNYKDQTEVIQTTNNDKPDDKQLLDKYDIIDIE